MQGAGREEVSVAAETAARAAAEPRNVLRISRKTKKSKELDGILIEDLEVWEGDALESPDGVSGMAASQASGADKRGADGDASAP